MIKPRLPPLPAIRDILKLYRLSALKQLSQNFLIHENLATQIVKCAGFIKNSQILEVGPGPGIITRSIIKLNPEKLILVEKDERFKPFLDMLKDAGTLFGSKVDIIFDDILNVKSGTLFDDKSKQEWSDRCPNIYIVGNLPFSISTALILRWLHDISEQRNAWALGRVRMVLTFQKEVAERLVAEVSGDQRCRLSIMAQAWTSPKLEFIIPRTAFLPKPKVDVGVVSFTPLIKPRTDHKFKFFEKINRHLFSFRQKYSVKSAGTLFPPESREHLSKVMFKLADLQETTRAFELSVEDISRLASAYEYLCNRYPEIIDYNYRASTKVLPSKETRAISISPV